MSGQSASSMAHRGSRVRSTRASPWSIARILLGVAGPGARTSRSSAPARPDQALCCDRSVFPAAACTAWRLIPGALLRVPAAPAGPGVRHGGPAGARDQGARPAAPDVPQAAEHGVLRAPSALQRFLSGQSAPSDGPRRACRNRGLLAAGRVSRRRRVDPGALDAVAMDRAKRASRQVRFRTGAGLTLAHLTPSLWIAPSGVSRPVRFRAGGGWTPAHLTPLFCTAPSGVSRPVRFRAGAGGPWRT
jgi:hypothetical protein